jgi:hypothetical protein
MVEPLRNTSSTGTPWRRAKSSHRVFHFRAFSQPNSGVPLLNRPELISEYMAPYAKGLKVEKFWVLGSHDACRSHGGKKQDAATEAAKTMVQPVAATINAIVSILLFSFL